MNGLRAVLATALVTIASCSDETGQTVPADSTSVRDSSAVDTASRLTANLPPGRFQLPTRVSQAPDLWITLPEGYSVKPMDDDNDDRFFIVHSQDPTLRDTSAVTPGFMRVYVGPSEQRPFDGIATSEGERVMVIFQPLQWRLAEEVLGDSTRYYQRDLQSSGVFGRLSPELAKKRIYLHVYVAGSDSARVAELMRAAETLNIVP